MDGIMQCPRCAIDLISVTIEGVTIDRCPGCGGILLDKGETETIDQLNLATVIEGGAQRTAEAPTKPAHCHACDKPMTALVGAGDVEFDWCDGCERIFFDRGELAAFDAALGE
jgi:Zn-finger nucleic acid-binding protein